MSTSLMHELGIMSSAIAAILVEAERHGAERIQRIVLRIGVLSGADPAALRFAFEIAAAGSLAAGAALEIETVPARAHCANCAADFPADAGFICACPSCGALSGDLRSGRELAVSRLEFTQFPPL